MNMTMKDRQGLGHVRLTAGLLGIFGAREAFAGMTSYDLNDVVRMRLEEISFFAVVLLLCGLGIRVLWNALARDFSALPKLNFKKAMALTMLLSVLMLLVLSMISGARELMTPGAWVRQGSGYRLNTAANEDQRRVGMESLRAALFRYAAEHAGNFPPHDFVAEIPERIWSAPDISGGRYVYFAGHSTNATNLMIACEPKRLPEPRYILLSSGEIQRLPTGKIHELATRP